MGDGTADDRGVLLRLAEALACADAELAPGPGVLSKPWALGDPSLACVGADGLAMALARIRSPAVRAAVAELARGLKGRDD
jgi:hypothetical protein